MYRARVLEGWDAARSARDLFLYADPDRPAQAREAMARGELSWWAAPRLRWRFFRPLAESFTTSNSGWRAAAASG